MKKSLLAVSLMLLFNTASAFATPYSDLYDTHGSYDAGQIDTTNFVQMLQYKEKTHYEATKNPAVVEEEVRQKMDLLNTKQVTFTLKNINITGNTVFPTYVLMRLVDFKIGQEVTINDLIMSANDITDYYQSKGYVSSVAYLPPQKVKNGSIDIIILEGKYGNVEINPGRWEKASMLNKKFLKDNGIEPGKVLNRNDIVTALQELNAEDYMKGSVSFTDNEDSEEFSDITLEVKDRFPIDLDLRYDNQGRELIGTQRGVIYAGLHNVTGHGDTLLGTVAGTARSIGAGGMYSIPIAKNETKLNLGYSYSHVRLGKEWKNEGITGSSHDFFLGVSRRLAEGKDYKLYGDLTFDVRNAKTFWHGNVLDGTTYRSRVIKGTVTDIKDDSFGRWLFSGSVSTGIPIDATTYNKDKALQSNNFVKLNANMARLQMLPKNSMAIWQVNGQYANRHLFPSEQMQFGGISTVRGFDEGRYIADYGVNTSIELRVPIPFLRNVLPDKYKFIDDSIRIAGFYDFGWFGDRYNSDGTNYMMSAGPGIVVKLTKYLSGNVYWGFPIGKRPDDTGTCRFHFMVTSNVL